MIINNVLLHKSGYINFRPKLVIPWDVAVNPVGMSACISSSSTRDLWTTRHCKEGNIDMFRRAQLG